MVEPEFYDIIKVAKLLDCKTSKVRWYQKQYHWLTNSYYSNKGKGKNRWRRYNQQQLNEIVFVHCLSKYLELTCISINKAYRLGYYEKLVEFTYTVFEKELLEQ